MGGKRQADGLTVKERRFVEAYIGEAAGNATKALRLAGYQPASDDSARAMASRLVAKVNVSTAITEAGKAVSEQTRRATIADIVEQEEFLTRVLRNEEPDIEGEHRLKAADQLAKRHGAYAGDKAADKAADALAAFWADVAKRKRIT